MIGQILPEKPIARNLTLYHYYNNYFLFKEFSGLSHINFTHSSQYLYVKYF